MPNWCENSLTVYGKGAAIKDFLARLKGKKPYYPWNEYFFGCSGEEQKEVLCFNALWPVPKDVLESGYDGGERFALLLDELKRLNIMPAKIPVTIEELNQCLPAIKQSLDQVNVDPEEKKLACELVDSLLCIPFKSCCGYDWQIKNWGTKWDVEFGLSMDESLKDNEETAIYLNADTAWSPFKEFLNNISPMFPELRFELTYAEPGCDFSGVYAIENGNVADDLTGRYGEYGTEIFGF